MAINLIPHVCVVDSPYDTGSGSYSCRISFTLYLNGTIDNFTLPFILDIIIVVFVVFPVDIDINVEW